MSEAHIYSPIIKGKANDMKSFQRASPQARSLMKPLVEMIPVPADVAVEDHLDKFAHLVVKHLPSGPLFIDPYGLKIDAKTSSGQSAAIRGLRRVKAKRQGFTPVYGFGRDDTIWSQLASIVGELGSGFCFRIDVDDMDDQAEETWTQILERTAQLGLSANEIDLFLDLRYVAEEDASQLVNQITEFLALIPHGSAYRSIVVAGSSALKSVSTIPRDDEGEVARSELRLWLHLQYELAGTLDVKFGDYGVIHPDFSDQNRNPNIQAKIRYTVAGKIIYFRGHNLFNPSDFAQYHSLAERVRNHAEYRGRNASYGDAYIDDCADINTGTGNLGTWVQVDLNRHFEFTANQVAVLTKELAALTANSSLEQVDQLIEA